MYRVERGNVLRSRLMMLNYYAAVYNDDFEIADERNVGERRISKHSNPKVDQALRFSTDTNALALQTQKLAYNSNLGREISIKTVTPQHFPHDYEHDMSTEYISILRNFIDPHSVEHARAFHAVVFSFNRTLRRSYHRRIDIMLARLSILFVSLCVCALAQTTDPPATNATTMIYEPDCNARNPDCDGRGVCMSGGSCRCWYGFFGYYDGRLSSGFDGAGVDNCILRADIVPGFREAYSGMRIYQGVIFGILTLIMVYRVALEFIISFSRGSTAVITRYTMILLAVTCLWITILSADFFGAFGNMNVKAYYVMFYFKDNLLLFVFSALLFHWAELYYAGIRKMKKEEMLRKIKPGYEPNLQMEDILLKISLVSKFRFAYVAVCVASLLAFLGMALAELHTANQHMWDTYTVFYYAFYTGAWILFAIGYIIYGLRLLQIIPEVLQGRIKAVMILMGLFTTFGVTSACINISFHANSAAISIGSLYVLVTLTFLMAFSSVNVFIPIWEWHQWMNPKVIRSMIRSTATTMGNTTAEMKSQEIVIEVSEQSVWPTEPNSNTASSERGSNDIPYNRNNYWAFQVEISQSPFD
ncbi:hypothetical protein PROFUN_10719 [Planoprotostelium fungivorum]|uniref:Uncharacterized protein n=1 Tax=Planoprotostelium fungivorum TaxID=1890364 RepID=A0A2P6N9N0_9EUKA|nr:hypothetical protein PROFUN_10719 [Planoprotostelium fungivorum]